MCWGVFLMQMDGNTLTSAAEIRAAKEAARRNNREIDVLQTSLGTLRRYGVHHPNWTDAIHLFATLETCSTFDPTEGGAIAQDEKVEKIAQSARRKRRFARFAQPEWNEDSPELWANNVLILEAARDAMRQRAAIDLPMLRQWRAGLMAGLVVDHPDFHLSWANEFRGQTPENSRDVYIPVRTGVPHTAVAAEMLDYVQNLQACMDVLDGAIPAGETPANGRHLEAVLQLCAWAHAEWLRIRPFVNGSGRTARVICNAIAMRYQLPPFLRQAPQIECSPGDNTTTDYELAVAKTLNKDWSTSIPMMRAFYMRALGPTSSTWGRC